jgi:hypothetical protein
MDPDPNLTPEMQELRNLGSPLSTALMRLIGAMTEARVRGVTEQKIADAIGPDAKRVLDEQLGGVNDPSAPSRSEGRSRRA